MLKPVLLLAIIAAFASSAAAQSASSYQVDNFDFANAVHIQTPKVDPPKKLAPATKRLTSSRNYTYSPAPDALVHLTSHSISPSLGSFTTGNAKIDKFIVDSGQRN